MTFGQSNGFASSQMSGYEDEEDDEEDMEEEEEEEEDYEDEDMDANNRQSSNRLSFLDSNFGNPLPPQSPGFGQPKPIYSNPTDARRPKLDERWAHQSPIGKTKLSPKIPPPCRPSSTPLPLDLVCLLSMSQAI